jgi:hypothetical protein
LLEQRAKEQLLRVRKKEQLLKQQVELEKRGIWKERGGKEQLLTEART